MLFFENKKSLKSVLISWQSQKIERVVRSTLSAECMACIEGVDSAFLLQQILNELYDRIVPITVFAYNESLVESVFTNKTVRYFVTKLDAHYGFYLLKNCFSLPKLLYFLPTSPCFEEMDLLQQYASIIRKSLSKICNVNFDESSYTQAILPVSKGGIGIASASQIALPAFLASATGAKRALSCILPEDYVDASFEKALDLWLTRANLTEAPSDSIQKHWTSPLSDAIFDQFITDLDAENVKRLNAYQDPFGSAWLNVVPSKNLGLKLTDQQLRIS